MTGMNYEGELPRSMLAAQRKSAYVARWLIAAIREGRYKVGEKLPSERTLAEVLNVSRTAVREALSSLQMAGLVEPRVGDGNYVVGTVNGAVDVDEALEALEESGGLVEVWRIRRELEVVIIKLAAQKWTEENRDVLEAALGDIKSAVELGDPDEYLEANNKFHLAIADMSRNLFLRRALLPLLEITKHQLANYVTAEYLSNNAPALVQKHREILEALGSRDLTVAARALEMHFAKTEEVFLKGNEVVKKGSY